MLLPALPSASGPFVGPGDRYPNRQLKTKSVPVWLLADSQPHSLHSLKRFFWRRSIVINHFGSKGASPALPSAPPCTEARRGPILARKRWASGIAASTLSSSGAGPNPCSPTTKPEFPRVRCSACCMVTCIHPHCALTRLVHLQAHLVLETLLPFRLILHWTTLVRATNLPDAILGSTLWPSESNARFTITTF